LDKLPLRWRWLKKRRLIVKQKVLSKKALAKQQGISRSSLYYELKQPKKDWRIKNRIESVLKDNPSSTATGESL